MPTFFYDISSPIFTILSTFLMCGAVIGTFSSINIANLEALGVKYQIYPINAWYCVIDALKYNIFLIVLSKFCGFLIPIFVLMRGFMLAFSISVVYQNSNAYFDKSMLVESMLSNFFEIPSFLIIATICFSIYMTRKGFKAKKSRIRGQLLENYRVIFVLILLNIGWNIMIM